MEEEDMDIDDFLEFPTQIGSQGKSEVWEVEDMGVNLWWNDTLFHKNSGVNSTHFVQHLKWWALFHFLI